MGHESRPIPSEYTQGMQNGQFNKLGRQERDVLIERLEDPRLSVLKVSQKLGIGVGSIRRTQKRALRQLRVLNTKPALIDEDDFMITDQTPLMNLLVPQDDLIYPTIETLLQDVLVKQGLTLREAEKTLGVSDSTIHAWKKSKAIEGRTKSSPKTKAPMLNKLKAEALPNEEPRATLERLYGEMSLREVAVKLGVKVPSVQSRLINWGIPRREPHIKINR